MNKRITLIVVIIFLFIFNGYTFYLFLNKLDQRRTETADNLYVKSLESKDNEKLYLLIQSDILVPTDSKKLEIANIYLKSANFTQADLYLRLISNPSGIIKYAENALEKRRYEAFDKLSGKISNIEARTELVLFKRFSEGDFDALKEIKNEPVTTLGTIMKSINTREYNNVAGIGTIVQIISDQKNQEKTTAELNIAKHLLEISQEEIAYFMINRVINESPEISDAYMLMAKYYEGGKDYKNAINYVKKAISNNPSKESYYTEGMRLSAQLNDGIEKSYFENRLKALSPLIN